MTGISGPAIMNEQNHIDQRSEDLLNGGIDGELSSSEQSELDSLLAGSDKLLDLNKELKSLTGLLDSLPGELFLEIDWAAAAKSGHSAHLICD